MTRQRHRLVGLIVIFAGLAALYSLTTPIFEAPDEVWHYAYVRYLAEGHGLPSLADDESGAYQEVAQPPLYYAVAALASRLSPDEDLEALMWHNPGFGYQAGVTVNDNKNMLIHTAREQFPWHGAVLAVRLARCVSLAFGLLTVVAAWGLGREAFPQRPFLALGVAALVAFTPQFLFISGVVSNDSAAAALATCALWAIARTTHREVTYRRSFAVGLLIGLATLTKTSALLLIPLAVLALILARRPPTQASSAHSLTSTIVHCSLFIVTAFAIGGWWYLRNALLYHDPLALYVHQDTPWGRTAPATADALLAQLPIVYRSFWGAFGWGHIQYPAWVYVALGVGPVVSLIGWGRAVKRRALPGSGRVFLLVAAWWMLVLAALLQWMRQVEAPHGRLLFPAIGASAMLLVGGWAALPRLRFTLIFLMGLIALSLLTPWLIIRPAFAPPRLLSPTAAAETVQGISLTYGDAAHLLGVSTEQASIAPGGALSVRACWEALAPMSEDYTVFIHLVGRDNARVAERYTYPGLGRFPTSLWPVGRAFCDVYRLTVEDWAPVPEMYDVVIGLYDASAGERPTARNSSGNRIRFPSLAQVRVAPEEPWSEPGPDVRPLDYKLGEQIALVGYQLSGTVRSGVPLTVTLYWSADGQPAEDYTVFVHLLEETTLEPLAQHDGPPRYGRYPTSAWLAGDLVPDEHVLETPALAAGQRVRLVVGMYQADTLERLQVAGPDGLVPDDLIPLPLR
jgi:4-amino-4-deoxy-L-arabinose transferase-like glycosyltransferase